jgi:hypothetical protein
MKFNTSYTIYYIDFAYLFYELVFLFLDSLNKTVVIKFSAHDAFLD